MDSSFQFGLAKKRRVSEKSRRRLQDADEGFDFGEFGHNVVEGR